MAEEEKEESTKKSGENMVLIIIVAPLMLLLVGSGLVAFLPLGSDNPVPTSTATQNTTSSQLTTRSTNMLSIGPIYPMDQSIVNLLSDSDSRYLKVTPDMELDSKKLAAEMDTKRSFMSDIIIRTLSAKTHEEIGTFKGKERLKDEVVSNLSEVLTDGRVRNIFFTDFVVQ